MNVTFHVVGNTAEEVRRAAEAEVDRFFAGSPETRHVTIDASGCELNTTGMSGPTSLIRNGYYATVTVTSEDRA